jgi:hypothetical protein
VQRWNEGLRMMLGCLMWKGRHQTGVERVYLIEWAEVLGQKKWWEWKSLTRS